MGLEAVTAPDPLCQHAHSKIVQLSDLFLVLAEDSISEPFDLVPDLLAPTTALLLEDQRSLRLNEPGALRLDG